VEEKRTPHTAQSKVNCDSVVLWVIYGVVLGHDVSSEAWPTVISATSLCGATYLFK
jgi:hypothetical protein